MTPRSRLALALGAVVVLVVGFVIAQSAGDDDNGTTTTTAQATTTTTTAATQTAAPTTTTTATTPPDTGTTIVITGGKPTGGVAKIDVKKGDRVRFTVKSDVSDEIHVHGYDLMKDVKAGGSVTFAFPANIDGKFEVELEGAGEQIASLTVEP